MPAEVGWIVKHYVADARSRSLREVDPTRRSHRNFTLAIQSQQVPKTTYSILTRRSALLICRCIEGQHLLWADGEAFTEGHRKL